MVYLFGQKICLASCKTGSSFGSWLGWIRVRSRCYSTVSQSCDKTVRCRPREASYGLHGQQSQIQRSSFRRLRATSPTELALHQNFQQNFSKTIFQTVSCVNLINGNMFLVGCPLTPKRIGHFQETSRSFHANSGEGPATSQHVHRNKKRKTDDHSDQGPNKIAHLLKNGVLTAMFVALCFGISDIGPKFDYFANLFWQYEKAIADSQVKVKGNINMYDLTTAMIIGANVLIYLLWKVKGLQTVMTSSFLINPTIGPRAFGSYVLSAFSHQGFFHLLVNMYVFNSFAKAWTMYAYRYQQSKPEGYMSPNKFSAFYLTAGTVAGLASHSVKILGGMKIPSLGASGAVLGLAAYICTKSPDSRLSIVFLPTWSFTAASGLKAVLLFDTFGLLIGFATGWRYFILDHAGHLGGVLYGLWYAKFGEAFLHRWSKCVSKHYYSTFGGKRPR
uniref:rhomboid protease n=1 Tax=Phallusia mammillata TaxID=59560 RepID=A0A6F9DMJ3_9ASCI|nr:rhomboid protein 1, mitochondrial [Phallusia mammillata]